MLDLNPVTGLLNPKPGDFTIAGEAGAQYIAILGQQRSDAFPAIIRCRQPTPRGQELFLAVGPEGVTPSSTFTILYFDGANGFKPSELTGVRGAQYWPDAGGFVMELALCRPRVLALVLVPDGELFISEMFRSDTEGIWNKDGTLIVQGNVLKPPKPLVLHPGDSAEIIETHGFTIFRSPYVSMLLQSSNGKNFPLFDPALSIEVLSFSHSGGLQTSMAILNDGTRKRAVFKSRDTPFVEAKGWFESIELDPALGPIATFAGKEFLLDPLDGSARMKNEPDIASINDGFTNLTFRGDPLLLALNAATADLQRVSETGLGGFRAAKNLVDSYDEKGEKRAVLAIGLAFIATVSGVAGAVLRSGLNNLEGSAGLFAAGGLALAGCVYCGVRSWGAYSYARALRARLSVQFQKIAPLPEIPEPAKT